MVKLLTILGIVTILSYLSQKQSINYEIRTGKDGRKRVDLFLILLIIFLVLFSGLRVSFNDTEAYIIGFQKSDTISIFLSNPENLEIVSNPLFYGFQALVRSYTSNANTFLLICALLTNTLIIRFIKLNTDTNNFTLSMFVYTCLGLLMFSIAAQKQILAMSILTLAITQLFDKHYVRYYIIVFIAGLIHTYAFLYLFLPLFDTKIWSVRTYILVFITVFVMSTFQTTISAFLEIADQVGKNIDASSIYNNSMNIFRVLVYSIIPLASLLFKNRLSKDLSRNESIFIQMTVISFMFMLIGTIDGANLFGRSAYYFSFGYVIALPMLIRKLFTDNSATIVKIIAVLCFIFFYCYNNTGFNNLYKYKTLVEYINEII